MHELVRADDKITDILPIVIRTNVSIKSAVRINKIYLAI